MPQLNIFDKLADLSELIPTVFYWTNTDAIIIGANSIGLKAMGGKTVIGKSVNEIYSIESASLILKNIQKVIKSKRSITFKETISIKNKHIDYFAIRSPLFEGGKLIGSTCILREIEHQKGDKEIRNSSPSSYQRIFNQLEKNLSLIPSAFYWKDRNHRFLGINKVGMEYMGFNSIEECLGKTDYDFWPKDLAEKFIADDNYVLETGNVYFQEDVYTDKYGNKKSCYAIKVPLYDEDGQIIGVIGNSIDNTAQKEAEQLRLENEAHKVAVEEQIKFRKRAEQLAHDINSPLASLKMLAEVYTDMPENYRLLLRKANDRIQDIAYDLLRDYQPKKIEIEDEVDKAQPTLVSALLFEILSEKRAQYLKLPVTFSHKFSNNSNFAFIKINRVAFARSISNIINNAVDALSNIDKGHVTIYLDATNDLVKIRVQDNGKGMPQKIKDKLLNSEAVTGGKDNGHGIGYTQIHDTISEAKGDLYIDTQLGIGTSIMISFPRIIPPDWIVSEITIGPKDIIVVLDDDQSIHDAWRVRFNQIAEEVPGIHVEHFTHGSKALEFFKDLTPSAKRRLFLLSDYELLKQDLNGLQIIQYSGINRAILVTSHYLNVTIRQEAMSSGIKILPKQLASAVAINIGEPEIDKECAFVKIMNTDIKDQENYKSKKIKKVISSKLEKIDLVLLDDDKLLIENLVTFMFKNMKVDTYYVPEELLKNISKYSKNTKFVLDYNCGTNMSGIDLAKILHEKGYKNLFILSGEDIESLNCGDYATAILKTDLDSVRKYLVKK